MLLPIQRSGSRPPLFAVHGLNGLFLMGQSLARRLGADQPLYGIQAHGFDGEGPPHGDVPTMVAAYVTEIRTVQPHGPYIIAGQCAGSIIAIEMARALTAAGESVGPVLMIDPPASPYSPVRRKHAAGFVEDAVLRRKMSERIVERLQEQARRRPEAVPFDPRDSTQIERATAVAIATQLALFRFEMPPFDGPTTAILSAERAMQFFNPSLAWPRTLRGPVIAHVIPGLHTELFREHWLDLSKQIRFAVVDAADKIASRKPAATAA